MMNKLLVKYDYRFPEKPALNSIVSYEFVNLINNVIITRIENEQEDRLGLLSNKDMEVVLSFDMYILYNDALNTRIGIESDTYSDSLELGISDRNVIIKFGAKTDHDVQLAICAGFN